MKKFLSLILAVAAAFAITMPAFAANPKITRQTGTFSDVDAGEVGPGYQIWIPLVKSAFDDATDNLTMTDIKSSKFTVKQTIRTGSKAIASVEIKEGSNKIPNIVLTLVKPYTSTKPTDFETKVTLYIDGKKQSFDSTITGTLSNDETLIYSDTDFVDLSEGQTAKCEETTSQKVEAYIGHDVSIFVKMLKGKDYYGIISTDLSNDDEELFTKYEDLQEVLTLSTIGLNGTGNIVKIDLGVNYYAYDKDLKYLGRTDSLLPYSTKYYLSDKNLNIVKESDDDDVDEPDDPIVEPDDPIVETSQTEEKPNEILNAVAPAASNKTTKSSGSNPDTGDSSSSIPAIALSLVSLVAAAVTGKKTGMFK